MRQSSDMNMIKISFCILFFFFWHSELGIWQDREREREAEKETDELFFFRSLIRHFFFAFLSFKKQIAILKITFQSGDKR